MRAGFVRVERGAPAEGPRARFVGTLPRFEGLLVDVGFHAWFLVFPLIRARQRSVVSAKLNPELPIRML
eukprot:10308338-Lingulodinium_polyedra.AAC.1